MPSMITAASQVTSRSMSHFSYFFTLLSLHAHFAWGSKNILHFFFPPDWGDPASLIPSMWKGRLCNIHLQSFLSEYTFIMCLLNLNLCLYCFLYNYGGADNTLFTAGCSLHMTNRTLESLTELWEKVPEKYITWIKTCTQSSPSLKVHNS